MHLVSLPPLILALPDLDLFPTSSLETFVGLATHDNLDIVGATVPCLNLLVHYFYEELSGLGLPDILVAQLARMDEKDDRLLDLLESVGYDGDRDVIYTKLCEWR